jgi:putative membrane protein insertion efficiency factor
VSFLKSWNPLNKIAQGLIRLYQGTFAHFLGGRCRYYPSCSHYSVEAYEKFSFLEASQLVFKRLSSCHPLSRKPFYDPVPHSLKEMSLS